MNKNTLLELKPIKKFIDGVGKKTKEYFGKNKGAIIALEDDGVFYGQGLWEWLSKVNKNITFSTVDDTGKNLDKDKVKGRKVLLVDNDVVTGKAYRNVVDVLMKRKKELDVKDIKFAVLCDRIKVADFAVEDYPMPSSWNLNSLDRIDMHLIKSLSEDGRKTFVDLAQETGLTAVGIKKRIEKLFKREIITIKARLNTQKFYSTSASVEIEASPVTTSRLIKKFQSCPLVYNLAKVSGRHNLIINFIAPDIKRITDLVEKQIRPDPKVRYLKVDFGELPIIPKTHCLPHFENHSKKCPCEKKCNECEYFL